MIAAAPPLVIGIGNILLRDEGVGVHVVVELERRVAAGQLDVPPGTRLVDGGTLGLELLPMISGASALILVDAVNLRAAPGSVAVIRGDAIEGTLTGHVSPHQVGIADLVAAARLMGVLPADSTLVGIQPAEIDIGLSLTPAVEAAVPDAMAAVCDELRRCCGTATTAHAGGWSQARWRSAGRTSGGCGAAAAPASRERTSPAELPGPAAVSSNAICVAPPRRTVSEKMSGRL
jgi:hydrogenase maturation protease